MDFWNSELASPPSFLVLDGVLSALGPEAAVDLFGVH